MRNIIKNSSGMMVMSLVMSSVGLATAIASTRYAISLHRQMKTSRIQATTSMLNSDFHRYFTNRKWINASLSPTVLSSFPNNQLLKYCLDGSPAGVPSCPGFIDPDPDNTGRIGFDFFDPTSPTNRLAGAIGNPVYRDINGGRCGSSNCPLQIETKFYAHCAGASPCDKASEVILYSEIKFHSSSGGTPEFGPRTASLPLDANGTNTTANLLIFEGYTSTTSNGDLGGVVGAINTCAAEYSNSRPCLYKELIKLSSSYPWSQNVWAINSPVSIGVGAGQWRSETGNQTSSLNNSGTCQNFTYNGSGSPGRGTVIDTNGRVIFRICSMSLALACCSGGS